MVRKPTSFLLFVGLSTLVLPPGASAAGSAGQPSALAAPVVAAAAPLALQSRSRPKTRDTAVLEIGGQKIQLAHPLPSTDSNEFAEIADLDSGAVVRFFAAPALRLRTAVAMRFGEHVVPVANVAPDYDGVYSVWIRKADVGWELVFNDQGDVWGTQHDAAADRVAVPLRYETAAAQEKFGVDLSWDEESASGTVTFAWGEHRWSAEFGVGEG